MRNTGSENAVANAARKAAQHAAKMAASRPERHAAIQRTKRAI